MRAQNFLVSILVSSLFCSCTPDAGPPKPVPCPNGELNCTPDPDDSVSLADLTLVRTAVINEGAFPRFIGNGSNYLLGTKVGATFFDNDSDQITAFGLANGVNALLPNGANFLLSTWSKDENNQPISLLGEVSSASDNLDFVSGPPLPISTSNTTAPDGSHYFVWGEVENEGTPDVVSRILLSKIQPDLSLGPATLVREFPGQSINFFFNSLKVATNGGKLLVTLSVTETLPRNILFLHDLSSGQTTDIDVPVADGADITEEILPSGDGFLIVRGSDAASERKLHAISGTGQASASPVTITPGRNLVPIKGGYLSARSNFLPDGTGNNVEVRLHRSNNNGDVVEERQVTVFTNTVFTSPTVVLLDGGHLAVFWEDERPINGVRTRVTIIAFFAS